MWNSGLGKSQAGIKIARRNINNLRYADDATLMAESEEELKSLLMRMKEESEKMAWNSALKTKIMVCAPIQFSSAAKSYPTFCDHMDCSMPGFPVPHQLPELTQTHVHWVSDAIQPSHPSLVLLLSIFPGIRIFSNESALCIRWPKYWSFSISLSRSVLLCTHSLHLVG